MSFDVQTIARRGDSSVSRPSSRLDVGKAIKTGPDYAHEPLRLVAFKKQPFGQIRNEQRASTSKCAGPEPTVTDRMHKSRFTLALMAIKKDKGGPDFCADQSRPSQSAQIDSGVPTIRHVLSIRLVQRISHSESSAFEVGERLGAILHRAGRSFGCTFGELRHERTRSRASAERDECTQGADISLFRAVIFMVDDPRAGTCHCVHRCGVELNRVLINETGSV